MTKVNKRIIGIDLIKCIACISVILLHVSMPVFYQNKIEFSTASVLPSKILYYLGTCAVPLFFMANGFFILNKKEISWSYIKKKILLIMVPVISWNLLLFIGYIVKGEFNKNLIFVILGSLLQKGFFFQFWFLGSLIILLLIAVFLNKLLKKSKKKYIMILIMLILLASILDVINHFSGSLPVQSHVIQTFRLWTWIMYYMLGGLIGNLYFSSDWFQDILQHKKNILGSFLIITILFLAYAIINIKFIQTPYAEYDYDNLIFMIWTVLIFIMCLSITKFSVTSTKIIELISKYSFGIYIVHVPILKVFRHFIELNSFSTNILGILFVFAGSFVLVYLLSKIPIIRKLVIF
ncbi:acyltransferase [Lapidilactobacillus dextrinicus]|uniref:acyltransferase n=1 Tax=Lapidilactobacillus dextrinicus TaxID=51664 RepID=UPI003B432F2F